MQVGKVFLGASARPAVRLENHGRFEARDPRLIFDDLTTGEVGRHIEKQGRVTQ